MSTIALTDRLREGGLVLDQARVEQLQGALERVAAARQGIDDVLTRVRLAHLLPADAEGTERFLGVVNKDSELVSSRDHQLLAVLATIAMVEDFGRDRSRRSAAVMRRVVIAALAARTLARSEHRAAHPDLLAWAAHLLRGYGQQIRSTTGLAQPPTLSDPIEPPEGEELTRDQVIDDTLSRHEDYARQTADWLEQSAGAGQIVALHEQNQILWWLLNRLPSGERSEQAIRAASELRALSLTPPPPTSAELFRRRLVLFGSDQVAEEEFEQRRSADAELAAAAGIAPELTPILSTGLRSKIDAAGLAQAIYEELTLSTLIKDERNRTAEQQRSAELRRIAAEERQRGEAAASETAGESG